MMSIRKNLVVLGAAVLGVGALSVGVIRVEWNPASAAPSTGPQPVLVTNAATQPVPTQAQGTTTVAGSVSITGTPAVSIDGTPSVAISGTPSVSVSGTPAVTVASGAVTVGNNPGTALLVRIDPGQPWAIRRQWISPLDVSGTDTLLYTVPAGKRLVVDYLSAQGFGGSGHPIRYWLFGTLPDSPSHHFVAQQMDPTSPTEAILSQAVSLTFGAGDNIYVEDARNASGTGIPLYETFQMSGHLLDAN